MVYGSKWVFKFRLFEYYGFKPTYNDYYALIYYYKPKTEALRYYIKNN